MDDDMDKILDRLVFIDNLRSFLPSDDAVGRIRVDINDLVEAGDWLKSLVLKTKSDELYNWQNIEKLIVDIQVNYIAHVKFHLSSLERDLAEALLNFPDDDDDDT